MLTEGSSQITHTQSHDALCLPDGSGVLWCVSVLMKGHKCQPNCFEGMTMTLFRCQEILEKLKVMLMRNIKINRKVSVDESRLIILMVINHN